MAHITFSHSTYKYSEVATALDSIGNFLMFIGIIGALSGLFKLDFFICMLAILIILSGFGLKVYVAPKVAAKTYEVKKQRMMREREELALQHIEYVGKDDYSIIIKCPKCTKPVSINAVCSCGCDIWRRDFLFKEEIEKIRQSVYGNSDR